MGHVTSIANEETSWKRNWRFKKLVLDGARIPLGGFGPDTMPATRRKDEDFEPVTFHLGSNKHVRRNPAQYQNNKGFGGSDTIEPKPCHNLCSEADALFECDLQ